MVLTTSLYMNGFKPVSELTARLTFCPIGFRDILVCEWIQTGVKSTKNRRFFNVLLTTSLYMNQLFTCVCANLAHTPRTEPLYVNGSKTVLKTRKIVDFLTWF